MNEPRPRDAGPRDEALDARARRMTSRLAYLRLRRPTQRWAHEERAKPLIVRAALIWLAVLLATGAAIAWTLRLPWLPTLALAMLAWTARVLMLVRQHLGAAQPPDGGRSE